MGGQNISFDKFFAILANIFSPSNTLVTWVDMKLAFFGDRFVAQDFTEVSQRLLSRKAIPQGTAKRCAAKMILT